MQRDAFMTSWGASFISAGTVLFRVWAPGQDKMTLRLSGENKDMLPKENGWFEFVATGVSPGEEYQFILADGLPIPDPASRAQLADVNGPSLVTSSSGYTWQNLDWKGRPWEETVIYEMHIGTFTPEGTFSAAQEKLAWLAETGITMIEVLPLSQFGGNRGWGYDGVLLYAPHSAYGSPDDFKAFVDAAHGVGISVVLDIVLNHFGPEGNYLPLLAPDFFDPQRTTAWGAGINYRNEAARCYIAQAPLYWLKEYRLDGLRFDAIDQMKDTSSPHILIEIAERIREEITDRPVHLTTEDSRNVIFLHPRNADGNVPLFTAEWNDDFHNAIHVLSTGETHAYYQDFAQNPEKLAARALAEGFAYQGEKSPQTGEPRGAVSRRQPPVAFVDFIQNHDQIGNRAHGDRLITLAGAERTRVLLAALLLSPHIPLLFMGEEYGETRPFLFFTDFEGELAQAVREGRAREFEGHSDYGSETVPDPNALSTFENSKLDWQKLTHPEGKNALALTRKLLALRQKHIVPLLTPAKGEVGQIVGTSAGFLAVKWVFPRGTLSLVLNVGEDTHPLPELPGETLFAWPPETVTSVPGSLIVRLAPGVLP
ncbi:malto-oligosyltrehalose trehalohydrolase [Rahnella sp. L72c]|uniref:Malto-oligosyltrehalose trehalohydrolase n=1 Tax=Rahnella perminowiae TaxID=2816244 RepID=A0ABS6L3W0_9GAMM|nr:malto-oligosyltrehalose trehalohydrolase [Rahnella perminowiae]MBU9836526.1 malto-oligosyltrehalose trehalohydrolase [Rahnella perminowiae]